jgi:7-cyano-7-deazaguanine synthase
VSESGIVIASGGLDSTVMVYYLHQHYLDHEGTVDMVSFDYGQRHRTQELAAARATAARLGLRYDCVDLASLRGFLGGSALTDDAVDVPHGHYAEASMAATVVPNRNAIMLSIATGIAVARGAVFVAAAMHAGDHPIYPDCRPEFITAFDDAMALGTEGHAREGFHVVAPFVHFTKADIVGIGEELGVPFAETWSCYEGGELHCGRCGTCVERIEAFDIAGVNDPTVYDWVEAP